jgi:pantothenate kinase
MKKDLQKKKNKQTTHNDSIFTGGDAYRFFGSITVHFDDKFKVAQEQNSLGEP